MYVQHQCTCRALPEQPNQSLQCLKCRTPYRRGILYSQKKYVLRVVCCITLTCSGTASQFETLRAECLPDAGCWRNAAGNLLAAGAIKLAKLPFGSAAEPLPLVAAEGPLGRAPATVTFPSPEEPCASTVAAGKAVWGFAAEARACKL